MAPPAKKTPAKKPPVTKSDGDTPDDSFNVEDGKRLVGEVADLRKELTATQEDRDKLVDKVATLEGDAAERETEFQEARDRHVSELGDANIEIKRLEGELVTANQKIEDQASLSEEMRSRLEAADVAVADLPEPKDPRSVKDKANDREKSQLKAQLNSLKRTR